MQIYEFEGKRLFAAHGIPVPRGAVWPEFPAGVERYVAKAQVRSGGRGKRGGIRFIDGKAALATAVTALSGRSFDGDTVGCVYVEERLEIASEFYLAVAIAREARCRIILASPSGGVDIEAVPPDRLLKLPINPLLGLRPFMTRRIVDFLAVPTRTAAALAEIVSRLVALAAREDAELAEINPLVLTTDGKLIAVDAKVRLDGNARFRHPEWQAYGRTAGTPFEAAIEAAGSVAIEVDPAGDMIAVMSGAGLMMATLDLLTAQGQRVRAVIDLGGVVLRGAEGLTPVFRAVAALRPKLTFINAYLQTALCDELARGIAEAYAAAPFPGATVVRLKGRNADQAQGILRPLGFALHAELPAALAAVAASS